MSKKKAVFFILAFISLVILSKICVGVYKYMHNSGKLRRDTSVEEIADGFPEWAYDPFSERNSQKKRRLFLFPEIDIL